MQVFGTLKLLMVLLGPSWLLLGRSWSLWGPSWLHLGRSGAHLGPTWSPLGPILGSAWGHLGLTWGPPGPSDAISKPSWGILTLLGPIWGQLGTLWGPSGAHFGTFLGQFSMHFRHWAISRHLLCFGSGYSQTHVFSCCLLISDSRVAVLFIFFPTL